MIGSAGVLLPENERFTQVRMLDKQGTRSDPPLYSLPERCTEAYAPEMRSFVHCGLDD